MVLPDDLVLWLKDIDKSDKEKVGEELSLLGEITRIAKVKKSFVILPQAYNHFKTQENLDIKITHLLGSMNHAHSGSVNQVEEYIRKIILQTPLPQDLVKKLFAGYEHITHKNKKPQVILTAYFLKDGNTYKRLQYNTVAGESVLIEKVRSCWAEIYEKQKLIHRDLHHENHHAFSVAFLIEPVEKFNLSGIIQTSGENHEKHHYVLQAHSSAKLVYDKLNKKIIKGYVLNEKNGLLLNSSDIKNLVEIAHKIDKALFHPFVIGWEKTDASILITSVHPVTSPIEYYEKRNKISGKSHYPGIKVGRVKFFDPTDHTLSVSEDEVIFMKKLTKNDIEKVKRASALIIEDDLTNETRHYIKHYGIPTLTQIRDAEKTYADGEIITVNATSGHIQKGSMLIAK